MLYGSVPGVSDRISRLVLGSLIFSPERMELTSELLDRFVAAGGTAIDTARVYGRGTSELAIGEWLRRRGRRDDLVIITKGAHHAPDGTRRVTPTAIAEDLLQSLAALGIETIDLYFLHRDDPDVPVGPIVECLNAHLEAGRIRAFGASNWTHQRIAEANAYAAAHHLRGFVASSPNLALAVPTEPMWPGCISVAGDPEALAWYRAQRLPLFAWSSQASGFFSGRFSPEETSDPNMVRVYYRADNWERLRRVREVAARHNTTPTRVALAWVLHHPLQPFALIGPRTPAELDDCLGALAVRLTPDEVAWLNLEQ
ncbi:MAG TPA: aldo/keto reductase [Chloroflexota bacterium]|nr:aldo/keto reductase [Chloroflexota bacterium]